MSANPEGLRFSPLEENILAAVTLDGGLTPEGIAERVGVLCSGFFLMVLKNMADRHILLAEGGGYVPAASPAGDRGFLATSHKGAGGQSQPDENA
jgi:hypothetical protein